MEIDAQHQHIKDRLLDELAKIIKLIQHHTINYKERPLTQESWIVKTIINLLDKILLFDLKDSNKGYWPIVREYTHPDLLNLIHSLKSINTSLGKGTAWLSFILNEGTTQNYLTCLAREEACLRKHYNHQGILRDHLRVEQLLTLLAGLEQSNFSIQLEIILTDASPITPLFHSSPIQPNFFARMTSSLTSSLASPVDSGVALVDSDTVSEATINDSLSLREDPIELQDNRINAILDPNRFNEVDDYEDLARIKETKVLDSEIGSIDTVKNFEAMTASDIVNQNHLKDDEIVFRRHRKKKTKQILEAQNIKRVSFNENLAAQFSASFLPEAPVKKCDVIAGRYSWCANGDAPYISKPTDPNATKSAMILPGKVSLSERGMPEGQEDPPKLSSSSQKLICSDSESIRSGATLNIADLTSCKKSLISRFIRSLHVKPIKKINVKTKPIRSMYIPGKFDLSLKNTLDEDITAYIKACNMVKIEDHSDFDPLITDKWNEIFYCPSENILKIFPLTLGYLLDEPDEPAVALLTNASLYFVSMRVNHGVYCHFHSTLEDLDSIILGPSIQSAMIIRKKSKIKSDKFNSPEQSSILACIADRNIAESLISTIEYTMRSSKPPLPPPCVRNLTLDDLRHLKKSLKLAGALDEEEDIRYYSIVRSQDAQRSPPGTPLGPSRDGHLMYRLVQSCYVSSSWQPGYFRLKGGVLYIFNDISSRLPIFSIALSDSKQCSGLARPHNASRPHTFRITTPIPPSIELAAADDLSVSDWLQALLQAAAQPSQIPASLQEERGEASQCTLILGNQHIITCRESVIKGSAIPISCARVADITAVRFPSYQQWCIVEFGCREVVETGGDWVLYFANLSELERFRQDLETIWEETQKVEFPQSEIQDDNISIRCSETNLKLLNLWHSLVNYC